MLSLSDHSGLDRLVRYRATAIESEQWRSLWRARGLALDHLLPIALRCPAPRLCELALRVESEVIVPGWGKVRLSKNDTILVANAASFMIAWISEFLPVQLLATDVKLPLLPSALSVRSDGSFDMLYRICATRCSVWKPFDGTEMALDVKLTGVDGALGTDGCTMRAYMTHARSVLLAARRQRLRIGECGVVAFLLRRPPCPTQSGRAHDGAFGFVAVAASGLAAWEPKAAAKCPLPILVSGTLLRRGLLAEPPSLPLAPPLRQPRPQSRWSDLEKLSVRRGWVVVQDFCKTFKVGAGNVAKGAERVCKRLRDCRADIKDWKAGGSGRPFKIARLSDLKSCYSEF